MTTPDLHERLMSLYEARDVLDEQIADLETTLGYSRRRRSRKVIPDCGTETAYQRHVYRRRKFGEEFDGKACGCAAAHAAHNRLRSAS